MSAQSFLRTALASNAVFSAFSALFILFQPTGVTNILGFSHPWILTMIAYGLLLFSIDLSHQSLQSRVATWRALYASMADILWVMGSIIILAIGYTAFSFQGIMLITSIALVVTIFAFFQIWGIIQIHRVKHTSFYRHCLSVEVPVQSEAMWKVISDLGNIQRYMPSLQKSQLLNQTQAGIGAIRHCINNKNQSWSEVCTDFQEGSSFTVRFLSEAPDFPFPAQEMWGGWKVESFAGMPFKTQVSVWWELKPKFFWMGPLLLPILAMQADRDFQRIIQAMAIEASSSPRHIPSPLEIKFLTPLC